ncbi:MAG TPA: bifunctional DNA-binding transcriptional regulator/O6-methylguanine-DNA methyltransferase Ada [Candidatus Kapabacteria bacterium]|nr:bifunctional DNA-binding transcriptional regulator/O6-methylguanine-DNA methyltransferase Ada [Candidatus Kapabacteria bacterium]
MRNTSGMVQIKKYRGEEARWRAVKEKDSRAEGQFFYGVKTTGVYCRPNCAAKLARRENIDFFESREAAERAGFRACKRCRPSGESQSEREREAIRRACEIIDGSDERMVATELAQAVGWSPFHFQRVFKKVMGVSPRQYAIAARDERARGVLREGKSVTSAIYDSGYNASSRFYERAPKMLGMQPREFQKGGKGVRIRHAIVKSALGLVLVAGTERGICCVHFGSTRAELAAHLRESFSKAELLEIDKDFEGWVSAVVRAIEEPAAVLKLPLDMRGTAFQRRVWQALTRIPTGTTTTYSDLAEGLGRREAVRAVARACATNPVAVIVPCHRVLRRDGGLAGYRWGLERKRKLLEREKRK